MANPSKSRAALALHRVAPMRFLVVAALVAGASVAEAQTMPMTCTGALTASVGLALPTQGVAPSSITAVFDTAECQCMTDDITMQLHITTAIPQSMANGQLQIWIGTGCDQAANRTTTSTFCEQVTNTPVTYAQFVQGSTSTNFNIDVPIPSAILFSPNKPRMCTPPQQLSNNIYLLFATTGDFTMAQSCSLNLAENTQTPIAVTPSVSSGDSAVTLEWSAPQGVGEQVPFEYQVLCADANGNVIPGKHSGTQAYSVCIDGVIRRRNNIPQSSSTGTGTDDGGVVTEQPDLMAVRPTPQPPGLGTEAVDGGTDDAGTVTNSAFATTLDPDFTCTGEIKPNATTVSARIDGLNNGQTYQFVLLAIDVSGNAIASPVVLGTPQPTEDLYRRYRDQGGGATGFCFIATAAYGSYENRYVKVLRDFRDEVLLPTESGRAFVDWYYAHSPAAAQVIGEHRALRILTQMVLWPVIAIAALIVYLTALQKALILTLILGWCFRRRFFVPRKA
jgi:hypothetical protein